MKFLKLASNLNLRAARKNIKNCLKISFSKSFIFKKASDFRFSI